MRILIIIIFILAALIASLIYSQSNITYEPGTSVDIGSGADVFADAIIINGIYSGGGTICTGPLPVELLSFTHTVNKRIVSLIWKTAFELNNSGFDIERKASLNPPQGGTQDRIKVGFIQGNGTTNEPKQYTYEDKKLKSGTYKYRLKQIDYNGSYEYFDLQDDVNVEPPKDFSIGQNYPNPLNPKSKIEYEIPISSKVSLFRN